MNGLWKIVWTFFAKERLRSQPSSTPGRGPLGTAMTNNATTTTNNNNNASATGKIEKLRKMRRLERVAEQQQYRRDRPRSKRQMRTEQFLTNKFLSSTPGLSQEPMATVSTKPSTNRSNRNDRFRQAPQMDGRISELRALLKVQQQHTRHDYRSQQDKHRVECQIMTILDSLQNDKRLKEQNKLDQFGLPTDVTQNLRLDELAALRLTAMRFQWEYAMMKR
mmetsp:Transcript_6504/g.9869  ORF Transcript_6504/g.9869 Transcript_6504/m.9869 type:complete len:221 (+) Transcript_6504:343-1005(+)